MNIQEIRAKYPQYSDLSDEQLGKALHSKFYADMPYEQFAAKAGIAKAAPTTVAKPSEPTQAEMIAGAPLTRFALGAASPILGAAQLGAEALGDTSGTETLKQLEQMKQRGMSPQAEIIRLKAGREQLSKLKGYEAAIASIDKHIAELEGGGSTPIDVAGMAGTVLSPAVLAAMKVPAAGSVLGRAAQGSAVGAAFGAASPVTSEGEFGPAKATQIGTGAAIGAAIPPAIDAVRAIGGKTIDILAPFFGGSKQRAAKILSDVVGDKRGAVEAELAKPSVIVPGSQPTAAEAASGAGSAELSGLERNISRHLQPSQYSDIGKAQEQARRASIQSFGKDKAAIEVAEKARDSTASTNYGAVRNQLLNMDAEVGMLLKRPSMDKALARASELADEAGEKFSIGVNRPEQIVPSRIVDASGKPAMQTVIPAEVAKYPVQSLHYVKMAMDDMMTTPERFGIGASEVRAIGETKKLFTKWLETKAPLYEKASSTYAAMSKPINEMQVGQKLEQALTNPLGEGERVGVFAQAMRDEPRTVQRATDFRSFEKLEDVLKPENIGKVRGVLSDLARKAESDRLAALGSKRAGELTEAYGLPATGPLHQQYMIFKTILGRVSKAMNEKALAEVAEALKLPDTTLRLLQRAPTQYQQQIIDQIIAQKLGRGAIAAGTALSGEVVQQ